MRGLFAGSNLLKRNKEKRRHDMLYKRRQSGKIYKSVLGRRPQISAIVISKTGIEAKQPNSAIRKICRVQAVRTGQRLLAFAPGDGALKVIDENDEVIVEGLGRRERAVGDMPGIRYQICKVAGVSLKEILRGRREKPSK